MQNNVKSYNQAGQEIWVRNYLNNKRNGFFLDIGAYDGIESSNTYFLEKELNWSGICIESNIGYYNNLIKNRSSICVNKAVMDYRGIAFFNGIDTYSQNNGALQSVECDLLENILLDNNSPKFIDYASFDIEGNELSVLNSFPFHNWNINLMTIEHNLYLIGDKYKTRIFNLLTSKGYTRVVDNVMCPQGPYEDWYVKN